MLKENKGGGASAAPCQLPPVALGHVVPVDDVPEGVDVFGALVLVLEVVGVLPDVAAQQRGLAVGDRRVLVRGFGHREVAGSVLDQPRPAGTELADAGVFELLLEGVEGAEGAVDRLAELATGLAATIGA